MKKYNLKNIAGLSLVEMLIGIVITSMMILAIIKQRLSWTNAKILGTYVIHTLFCSRD